MLQGTQQPLVVPVAEGALVDIIINNLDDLGHVLHLDGYEFHVMAQGQGLTPGAAPSLVKDGTEMSSPLSRDTVFVPGKGYTVLRLRAGRPGLWPLRSTILWDEAIGMNMVVQVGKTGHLASGAREGPPMSCDD